MIRLLLPLVAVLVLAIQVIAAEPAVVIDVRTPEEFSSGHVEGALSIDVQSDSFAEKIQKLDKTKSYKLYCRSGRRSGKALETMKSMGFKDVENLGGVDEAKASLSKQKKK